MSVDLSTVKVGMNVRLRNESVLKIVEYRCDLFSFSFPFKLALSDGSFRGYSESGKHLFSQNSEYDIIEVLSSEEPKEETCLWSYDRDIQGRPDMPIWKTSCGREFDRLQGGEQPRKHLRMEYCPYCGKEIKDMTTDC